MCSQLQFGDKRVRLRPLHSSVFSDLAQPPNGSLDAPIETNPLAGGVRQVMTQRIPILSARPSAAPRLISMALIGAGLALMTLVIVVQGRTIQTQRALIQTMFEDSSELNKLRQAADAEKAAPKQPSAHNPALGLGSGSIPQNQATAPSTAPSPAPSTEPSPSHNSAPGRHKSVPETFPTPSSPRPGLATDVQHTLSVS